MRGLGKPPARTSALSHLDTMQVSQGRGALGASHRLPHFTSSQAPTPRHQALTRRTCRKLASLPMEDMYHTLSSRAPPRIFSTFTLSRSSVRVSSVSGPPPPHQGQTSPL